MKAKTIILGTGAALLVLTGCGKSEPKTTEGGAPKAVLTGGNDGSGRAFGPESDPRLPVPSELQKNASPLTAPGKTLFQSAPSPLATPPKK